MCHCVLLLLAKNRKLQTSILYSGCHSERPRLLLVIPWPEVIGVSAVAGVSNAGLQGTMLMYRILMKARQSVTVANYHNSSNQWVLGLSVLTYQGYLYSGNGSITKNCKDKMKTESFRSFQVEPLLWKWNQSLSDLLTTGEILFEYGSGSSFDMFFWTNIPQRHCFISKFLMVKLILNQIRHDYCKTHCKAKQISMKNKCTAWLLNQCWQMWLKT